MQEPSVLNFDKATDYAKDNSEENRSEEVQRMENRDDSMPVLSAIVKTKLKVSQAR